jgi:hypothetical protein
MRGKGFGNDPIIAAVAVITSRSEVNGINILDADVPPGEFTVRIEVKETDGHPGATSFTLKISP